MIYVFEGARNSGKTYLSKFLSDRNRIPRFQFDFVGGVNLIPIPNSAGKDMNSFGMGKELMLMQLCRDLPFMDQKFIHDRGFLSVLAWGIIDKRISPSQALSYMDYFLKENLLNQITLIYIEGENPDKSARNKDQWDYADGKSEERQTYEFLLLELQKRGFKRIVKFKNDFTAFSCDAFSTLFQKLNF